MATETLWIVLAVVAAVLLIALIIGLVLRRQRRISLRDAGELERGTGPDAPPPRKGGTYQAESGFSFTSGTATAPRPAPPSLPPEPRPAEQAGRPVELAPPVPAAPTPTAPTPTAPVPAAPTPAAPTPAAPPPAAPTPAAPTPAAPTPAAPTPAAPTPATPSPTSTTAAPTPTAPTPTAPTPTAPTPTAPTAPAPAVPAPPTPAPTTTTPAAPAPAPAPTAPTTPVPAPPAIPDIGEAAPPAAPPEEPTTAAPATRTDPAAPVTPLADPRPSGNGLAPAPAPTEPIAAPEGRLERLRGRLARSRSTFGQGLLGLLGAGELDEDSWEDVEATLLLADLGPDMTAELIATMRTELARRAVRTTEGARQMLRDVLTDALRCDLDRSVRALPHDGRPAVLLVVGVNGTGKTTTTGKLARVLVAGGHRVVLGAADTFRAAAAEQLVTWGERAGATVVRGAEGADPASVAFDAVKRGTAEGADAVLLDTAGRLHTKTGLMDELDKIKRVVSRQSEVDEVLLVLDATTGQNGLTQARVFGDVVDVTGIVLTKLDGTAKGGIVFRVQRELGVPVKLVGLGEGPDDLAPFEPAAFVDALLG